MLVSLGWMLLAGLPLANRSPIQPVPAPARPAAHARPAAGHIAMWTDRDDPYRRGEGARIYLDLDQPAHVTVFRVDTDGRIRVLFPREPWGDSFIREDEHTVEIPGNRGGRSFIVDDYPGVGYLFAISSPEPFDYDAIARGDYWDYRLIDGGRIEGDPYVVLTDLAERIAPDRDYDYDVVPYYVDRRYDYPRFVCYDCHAYASFDEWNPYQRPCTHYRVVVYDDPRYYPYHSGRGRNVVASRPTHPGPRYEFRDADPTADYITRMPSAGRTDDEGHRRGGDRGRTSEDVGGPGSIPTPSIQSLGGRNQTRPPELSPSRRLIEERRRQEPAVDAPDTPDDSQPEAETRPAQPAPTRVAPSVRRTRPPQSTGEPELRRRKP